MTAPRPLSRRAFLRLLGATASAALAGAALPTLFLNRTRAATGENPANLVRVGFIGVGGQGLSNLQALMKHAVAVCDVDTDHIAKAKERVEKAKPGLACAGYADHRRLLEDKSVDAVVVSTPDHWHALASADALVAGKDVYCEKPLTLTIAEGQALVKLARKHGRVFQTGSQQRSDPKFLKAAELIRNHRLGKLRLIRVGLPGVNWTKDAPVPDGPPPPELDYDRWLGPAPQRPYNKQRVHYYFRFFWDYSGGQMTNWGAHHLDIVQWALGMDESGPVEIEGKGVFNAQRLYEVPETFDITYRYADGVTVLCESGRSSNGVTFEGERGKLYVNRGALEATPDEILEEPFTPDDTRLYVSKGHHQNWIDCIKSRKPPICDVAIGHRSATVCHLGNISVRTGRKLKWDPVKEQILGDAGTAKWADKAYRAPWKLPLA